MELSTVIKNRRSIRHFNEKMVNKEVIEDILNYAILAPSARNKQPWYFYVVEDINLKNEIANRLQTKMGDISATTANVIRDCACLILVFADVDDEIMDIISMGACIQNMILRATDLGVASLWIGYIINIEKELKDKLRVDKKLVSAVALGYTDVCPNSRPRKSLDKICTWI